MAADSSMEHAPFTYMLTVPSPAAPALWKQPTHAHALLRSIRGHSSRLASVCVIPSIAGAVGCDGMAIVSSGHRCP
eukprot:9472598-Pyramimonas_sp.AAC.1